MVTVLSLICECAEIIPKTVPALIAAGKLSDSDFQLYQNALLTRYMGEALFAPKSLEKCVQVIDHIIMTSETCRLPTTCGYPVKYTEGASFLHETTLCYGTGACDSMQTVGCNMPYYAFEFDIDFTETGRPFSFLCGGHDAHFCMVDEIDVGNLIGLHDNTTTGKYYYTTKYCATMFVTANVDDMVPRMPAVNAHPLIRNDKFCYHEAKPTCDFMGPFDNYTHLLMNLPVRLSANTFEDLNPIATDYSDVLAYSRTKFLVYVDGVPIDAVEMTEKRTTRCFTVHEIGLGISSIYNEIKNLIEHGVSQIFDRIVKGIQIGAEKLYDSLQKNFIMMANTVVTSCFDTWKKALKWEWSIILEKGLDIIKPVITEMWRIVIVPVTAAVWHEIARPLLCMVMDNFVRLKGIETTVVFTVLIVYGMEVPRAVVVAALCYMFMIIIVFMF